MRVESKRLIGVVPVAQQVIGISAALSNAIELLKDLGKIFSLDRAGNSFKVAIQNYNNQIDNGSERNELKKELALLMGHDKPIEECTEAEVRTKYPNDENKVEKYYELVDLFDLLDDKPNQSYIQPVKHFKKMAEGIITAMPLVGSVYNGYYHLKPKSKPNENYII